MQKAELYIAHASKLKYLCSVQKNKTMKTKTFTSKIKSTFLVLFISLAIADSAYAQNWTQINTGTTKKINTICFTSSTIGYLGGNDSLLMKTTDGGATWNQINYSGINFLIGGEHIINMQFLNDNVGFITVGPYSGSYGTSDGGLTWSLMNLPGNQCYNQGVFFFDENNGFIGGSGCFQGELISYISNSPWLTGTWTPSMVDAPSFNPSNIIVDIDFYDPNYGLAASKSGYIYRTTDGGLNWDSITTPAPLNAITSVIIVNDTLAYAGYETLNSGFGLYITTDAGLTWSYDGNSATFLYPNFYTLHQTSNGTVYTGGNSSTIVSGVIFNNQGAINNLWTYDLVSQTINDVASYNDSIVFAVGDSGYMVVNYPQLITSQIHVTKPNADFKIFPNPATSTINFSASWLNQSTQVLLKIYDAMGQLVQVQNLKANLDVNALIPGIYFIEVLNGNQQILKKLIIE
jgi:photosystem II stability/assembly factor-like uncharacterized protein